MLKNRKLGWVDKKIALMSRKLALVDKKLVWTDRKPVWVGEYVIGIVLLVIVMPFIVRPQPGWSTAHGWAYLLFLTSSSIILISCASAMRQRIQLAERIAKLEQMAKWLKPAGKQVQNKSGQRRIASKHLVGSVN